MQDVLGILTGMLAILMVFGTIPAAIILIYYFSRKSKNKERMALIEKGMDASIFIKEESTFHKALMWGMLIGGVGLGLFIGYIVSVLTGIPLAPIMPILALLFGGFGLIGYYIYRRKAESKQAK